MKLVARRHSSSSLFVRLDPEVIKKLYFEAFDDRRKQIERVSNKKDDDCWDIFHSLHVSSSEEENTIIFLPLCIKINERFIYVSYNGGAISHDEYQSVIELHPMFLKEYEEEDSLVDVKPLGYVKNTCRIFVSPCSVAEWELIECFSQFLEDGGILKHVNVVFPNQILEIRLPSKDVVRLKVLEKGFLPNNKECCLRLVSNTEVIISPLKRKENFYESPTLRVTPVYSDIPAFYASHLKESPVENNKPFQIALSKETYQLIPGISEFIAEYKILVIVWRVVNPSVTGDNKEVSKKIVVQLVCNDSIPLVCVGMFYFCWWRIISMIINPC